MFKGKEETEANVTQKDIINLIVKKTVELFKNKTKFDHYIYI